MVVEPVYAVTTGEFTAVGQEQAPRSWRDWKDPPVVGRPCEYLVRRLIPTSAADCRDILTAGARIWKVKILMRTKSVSD